MQINIIEFKISNNQDGVDFRSLITAMKEVIKAIAISARNKFTVCIPRM
ncbi:hypothetical protein [Pedobacter sp. Leaf216]|nr:hypothetical protein [Pedobacter sp. Leaf216]